MRAPALLPPSVPPPPRRSWAAPSAAAASDTLGFLGGVLLLGCWSSFCCWGSVWWWGVVVGVLLLGAVVIRRGLALRPCAYLSLRCASAAAPQTALQHYDTTTLRQNIIRQYDYRTTSLLYYDYCYYRRKQWSEPSAPPPQSAVGPTQQREVSVGLLV